MTQISTTWGSFIVMTELILIHRPRNGNTLELSSEQSLVQSPEKNLEQSREVQAAIWSTCLRQIAFVHSRDFSQFENKLLSTDEIYQGEAAFAFILEVVCGLKSPLMGETEVQGQFKQFVAEMPNKYPLLWGAYSSFFQGIQSESKRVRTVHLKNLGSQSYGSLIRRRLKSEEAVAIVGAGQLTQQILPWLKQVNKIQVHARSPEKAKSFLGGFEQVEILDWPRTPEADLVVLAAPVSNEVLLSILKKDYFNNRKPNGRTPQRVIDLRGEAQLSADHLDALGIGQGSYESLQELMSEMDQDQMKISEKVTEAKRSIGRCGESFMNRSVCRPGGWEDLCG